MSGRESTSHCTDPIVIVSATRSGSTLLQRLLNSSGDVTIWGEHFGLLTPLTRSLRIAQANADALSRGKDFSDRVGDPGTAGLVANPHVNPFDTADYAERLREFIDGLFAAGTTNGRWGFKEVRYRRAELEALRELFPAMRVIVLVRRPEEQIFSMARTPWRKAYDLSDDQARAACAEKLDRWAANWTDQYRALRVFCEEHPDLVVKLTFDQLRPDAFRTDELGAFLGLRLDETQLGEVFAARLGSSDETARWTSESKDALRSMIDELEWPEDHADVRSYFLPSTETV